LPVPLALMATQKRDASPSGGRSSITFLSGDDLGGDPA
jgi:hypothetical protein